VQTPLGHCSYLVDLAENAENKNVSLGQLIVSENIDLVDDLQQKEGLVIKINREGKIFVRSIEEQEYRAKLAKESAIDGDDDTTTSLVVKPFGTHNNY
jgi:hypothetical protein